MLSERYNLSPKSNICISGAHWSVFGQRKLKLRTGTAPLLAPEQECLSIITISFPEIVVARKFTSSHGLKFVQILGHMLHQEHEMGERHSRMSPRTIAGQGTALWEFTLNWA